MTHTRLRERAEIAEMLEAGQSISMLAPRRIGKTWLMKRVAEDLRAMGWNAVYIEIAGTTTAMEVVQKLCGEIDKSTKIQTRVLAHVKHRFERIMGGGEHNSLVDAISKVDPNEFLESLIDGLNGEDRKTLILIDEIALFVLEYARKNRDATHSFLYRLRNLQQRFENVRWFFTGSVGLDVVAQRYDLRGALVDLHTYPLEPFSAAEALSYCLSGDCQPIASRRFEFDDGAFMYLVEQLGWLSPYYLERVLSRVSASQISNNGQIARKATTADIEAGIEAQLGPSNRIEFAAYDEHLRKNFLPDDTKRLRAILDVLARHPTGEMETTLIASEQITEFQITLRQLKDDLLILLSDGFLEQKADRWCFRSGLLRRYWLRYEV